MTDTLVEAPGGNAPCRPCNGNGWTDEGDPEIGSAVMTCDRCGGTGIDPRPCPDGSITPVDCVCQFHTGVHEVEAPSGPWYSEAVAKDVPLLMDRASQMKAGLRELVVEAVNEPIREETVYRSSDDTTDAGNSVQIALRNAFERVMKARHPMELIRRIDLSMGGWQDGEWFYTDYFTQNLWVAFQLGAEVRDHVEEAME